MSKDCCDALVLFELARLNIKSYRVKSLHEEHVPLLVIP